MPASETLEIIVKGKDQASKALGKVGKEIGVLGKTAAMTSGIMGKLQGGLTRLTGAVFSLKGALAGLGLGLLVRSFMAAAQTSESYRTRLVTLMGDVKKANELFAAMGKFASGVAFEYEEIMGAATTLSGVMTGGTEEIKKWMPMISDLAATSGLGIQETTSQIVRMYSAGAASADLFRERGILAMMGFQAGVSVTAKETRKRLIEAWEDPASKFRGAAEALSRTWSGMMSMMADAWFQFRNMVMDTGVFNFIKAALDMVLQKVNELRDTGELEGVAKRVGEVVLAALEKIIKGAALAVDSFRGLKMVFLGLKAAFALYAEFVNRGLASIYDSLDWLVQSIGKSIQNIAKLITIVDITGLSKGLTESLDKTGKLVGGMKGVGDEARKSSKYWYEIGQETTKALNEIVKGESALQKVNKLLGSIKKRAAEYAADAEKAGKVKPPKVILKPEAKASAMMKSELMRMNELIKTNLLEISRFYAKGLLKYEDYFDKRKVILEKQYKAEMDLLKKTEAKVEDPTKKLAIQDRIFKREQQFTRDMMKLSDDREKAKKEAAKRELGITDQMAKLKARVEFDSATNISNVFRNQQAELEKRQSDEIEKLKSMKAEQADIEEAHRLHQLERDKQIADQRKQVQQIVIDNMKQSLGFMEQGFADAYQASGNTVKEFFYAQKAASIASTIISTYEAAQKAYMSLVGIPYVGPALGITAAAFAVAAGMARVAAIRTQSLAAGGKVAGYSPSTTADNIPISATAGEFMQPVDAVRHYGLEAMDAIRRKLVPKEILQGFNPASFTPNYSYAMAAGGSVPSNGKSEERPITINNILDPALMDQYVSTTHGQRNILNVMSQNAFAVKQILQSEG